MKFIMKDNGYYTELPYGRLEISSNEEFGIPPFQLLLASIAGCSGGVLRTILEKMRMVVEDIQIEADVERNPRLVNKIEKVRLHFKIKGKNMSDIKIEKAIALTKKNCSMVQSVIESIEIIETFETN